MTQISNELLLAYLDGQLDRAQAAGIGELASGNPEISRRLLRLQRTQAHLMETFAAIRDEERQLPIELASPEPSLRAAASAGGAAQSFAERTLERAESGEGRERAGLMLVVSALALGLAGGYAASAFLPRPADSPPKIADRAAPSPPSAPGWFSDIARFHAFFPKETLTPHPDAVTNPDLIRFQLTKVSGRPLAPPDFSRQGYALSRGQVFNYAPGRMMQLTYASKNEPPIALYVIPGGGDSPLAEASYHGFKSVGWAHKGVRFLIAAQKSEDDLEVLATLAQGQMKKP
jgi:anti-sigma factor RsiW